MQYSASAFGNDFLWGVAIAAAQNEGAWNIDGREPSIWDVFARRQGNIKGAARPTDNCNFYHCYKDGLLLVKALGFNVFRFSFSWCRIFPDGIGRVNKESVAFYHKLIDECLQLGLLPFATVYHWDLPHALQKEAGCNATGLSLFSIAGYAIFFLTLYTLPKRSVTFTSISFASADGFAKKI